MGVDWFLECAKCEEIVNKLKEIQQEDEYETFIATICYRYYFGNPRATELNVDHLIRWLQKHRRHGKLFFNGQ